MAQAFSMQIIGIENLSQRLKAAPEIIQREVRAKINDGANNIVGDAVSAAPVRYGVLKNLITKIPAQQSADGFTAVVLSQADYSAYVEFGTGTKVSVPEDLADYAIQFKGTHAVKGMSAKPFFFPAAKKNIPLIIEDLERTIEKL